MPKSVGDRFLKHAAGKVDLVQELRAAKNKQKEGGQKVILHKMIREVSPNYKFYRMHAELIKQFQRVIDGECKRLIVSCPPRFGKQVSHSTPVLTAEGWKTHGQLRVGDYVFSPSGTPVKVVALSEDAPNNAKVQPWGGEAIECHLNHEWTVFDRKSRKWRTVETRELVEWSQGESDRSRYQLPDIAALEFEPKDLPLDPYVLGVWLGGGTADANIFCGAYEDRAIADEIERRGYKIARRHKQESTGAWSYRIDGLKTGGNGRFSRELSETGARKRKHIPGLYLRASVSQRLQLLAGLVDTEGSVDKNGRTVISACSEELAQCIKELCMGLGFRPCIVATGAALSSSGIQSKKSTYAVGFQPNIKIPCVLERKKTKLGALRRRVGIVSAEITTGAGLGRCIQVDSPDGLYLVGRNLTPTHNSELSSRILPAAFLLAHPNKHVAICSYSAELAEGFSRDARDYYQEAGGPIDPFNKSVSSWGTEGGGQCWAAGVGGSVVGRSADLIIADDTIKGREEADSKRAMEKLWDFFRGSLYTRLQPGNSAIVVVATRWAEGDLTGRLLEMERECEEANREGWTIIDLPAISEDPGSRPPLPEHCTVIPDWRTEPGISLCPQRYDEKALERIRSAVGIREWSSQYQQRPAREGGNMFSNDWWQTYESVEDLPEMDRVMLSVDCTFTDGDMSDYVVGMVVGQKDASFYVLDLYREKTDINGTLAMILRMQGKHSLNGTIIELAASGHAAYQLLRRRVPGMIGYKPGDRSKQARMAGIVPIVEAGNVYLPKTAPWLDAFLNELNLFPASKNDDMCDAIGQAINYMNARSTPKITEVHWGRAAALPELPPVPTGSAFHP
jgi:predicted phage terminase large subunit-like protein